MSTIYASIVFLIGCFLVCKCLISILEKRLPIIVSADQKADLKKVSAAQEMDLEDEELKQVYYFLCD